MMNIALIGASSKIAQHFVCSNPQYNYYLFGRHSASEYYLDLEYPETIAALKGLSGIDLFIIFACLNGAFECALSPRRTWDINVINTCGLIDIALRTSRVIFLSSASVFSDRCTEFFEHSPPSPNSLYGHTKYAIEEQYKRHPFFLALRLSKVVCSGGLFTSWLKSIDEGSKVSPFVDYLVSPLTLSAVSSHINFLISSSYSGIAHLASDSMISYFDLLVALAFTQGIDTSLIVPATVKGLMKNHFSGLNSRLDISRNCSRLISLDTTIQTLSNDIGLNI